MATVHEFLRPYNIGPYSSEDDPEGDPLEGWDSAEVSMPLKCVGDASLGEVKACTIGVTSTSPGADRTTQ
jgi:hypothetical protein